MSVQIEIYDTATKERHTFHVHATMDEAKQIAIEWLIGLGGLRGKALTVTSPRGTGYRAAPREKNNGPGRYVWHKI